MGPRSEDRGNLVVKVKGEDQSCASMGPRSEDRGNGRTEDMDQADNLLQWGRDLKIAEMHIFQSLTGAMPSLQWGRDLKIAEIRKCNVN